MNGCKNYINKLVSLLESKDHLINKLDLEDEQKDRLKAFFKKHPNYESKIDWNNKDLQWEDFENLLTLEGKSKSQAKKVGIEGLIEDKDYKILAKNEHYTIYYPLTHLGSKVLASTKVAPYDEAKWCIAMNDPSYWHDYIEKLIDFFFIFFFTDEDGANWENKFAISRSNPNKDPYEDAHYQKWALSLNDEMDENDYPEFNFHFFDSTDQEYEDWTGLPFFKDICKVIQSTPNYLKDLIWSLDRQPGLEIKYANNTELCTVEVKPEAEGQVLKVRPGTISIGSAKYNQWSPNFHNPSRVRLAGIEIPDSVKRLEDSALAYSGITQITLPGSVEFIGQTVFGAVLGKDPKKKVITDSADDPQLEITFKEKPKKLDMKPCSGPCPGLGWIAAVDGRALRGVLNWPGTIQEFALALFNGRAFNASMLYDGELEFRRFGLKEVRATDGTFDTVRIFRSMKDFKA